MPLSPAFAQLIEHHLTRTGAFIANLTATDLTADDVRYAVERIGARHGREVSIVATPSGTLVAAVFPDWRHAAPAGLHALFEPTGASHVTAN
ncbi:hypothetical protein [Pseudactinotalea sp. Z1748]|uniref:hypothetical protein n=1 Tax=Pseudactinotalea sp. Z1748 TaxID=3413027 RepID=UPI003C7CBE25